MKGYSKQELIENGKDIKDFEQCQNCLEWFVIGELCEGEEDGIDLCPHCL